MTGPIPGIGVAGNFAGHLEQAGEAGDFDRVTAVAADAPKGIFPFFIPGRDDFLGTDPVSSDTLIRPPGEVNLQIEPEVGVLCRVSWEGDRVTGLAPYAIGAFNDCSIRREGARKISEKKNWGPCSKGFTSHTLPIDRLEDAGHMRLGSFLVRDGETHPYGQESALSEYSYYGDQLLEWLVDRLNHQTGSDDTPLEPVGAMLARCPRREQLLVGIGATRYTPFGESTYLEVGDEAIVAVVDPVAEATGPVVGAASLLRQRVVAA